MTEIERIKKENMGFIGPNDLAGVIRENRLQPVLVRCGNGRFVCPAQDVEVFTKIIMNEKSNYVRDISLTSGY